MIKRDWYHGPVLFTAPETGFSRRLWGGGLGGLTEVHTESMEVLPCSPHLSSFPSPSA